MRKTGKNHNGQESVFLECMQVSLFMEKIRKMRFSVFTHAEHYFYEGLIYSYGPYVREMNYWISEFDEIHIIAPFTEKARKD